MKRNNNKTFIFASLFLIILGFIFPIINNESINNSIKNNANNIKEYKVNNYEELNQAMYEIYHSTNSKETNVITLNKDINLANFDGTPAYSYGLSESNPIRFEFDGQGHKFYNKPEQYYFDPILMGTFWDGLNGIDSQVKVENLVLDDAPVLIGTINQSPKTNYNATIEHENDNEIVQAVFDTNAIWFNNITIKNTSFSNHNENNSVNNSNSLSPSSFGLLVNEINFLQRGAKESDTGLYIGNILIVDNAITNNNFKFQGQSYYKSLSWLTNVNYIPSAPWNFDNFHKGYIIIENINITNNLIYDNTLEWNINNTSKQFVSFGNLIGSFLGAVSWKGTSGNFLSIKNINIENNVYEFFKPSENMNENAIVNNSYAELISKNDVIQKELSKTIIDDFNKILILNNLVYKNYDVNDSKNNSFFEQAKLTSLSVEDVGNKNWLTNASKNMFFVGPNYKSSNNLNLVGINDSNSEQVNNIKHESYILTSSDNFKKVNDKLFEKLGIYGYILDTKEWTYDSSITNQEVLWQIILPRYDRLIVKDTEMNLNDKSDSPQSIKIDFEFVLKNTFINTGDNHIVPNITSTPYEIYNVALYQGDSKISIDNQLTYTTSSDENYIYSIDLELKDATEIDWSNLYLKFNYYDNQKSEQLFYAKLNINYNGVTIPNPIEPGNPETVTNSSTFIIILVISLLLTIALILLIVIYLMLRNKKSKTNTQIEN